MRRNGASFVLFSLGEMGHRTMLLRLSAVLRNAVVMCRPYITPDNCWHKTTWPEFQPSLPPGQFVRINVCKSNRLRWSNTVGFIPHRRKQCSDAVCTGPTCCAAGGRGARTAGSCGGRSRPRAMGTPPRRSRASSPASGGLQQSARPLKRRPHCIPVRRAPRRGRCHAPGCAPTPPGRRRLGPMWSSSARGTPPSPTPTR